MLKRAMLYLLFAGAALLLPVSYAAAQVPAPFLVTQPQSMLSQLPSLVVKPAVAPQIHRLEAPETLASGEEGLFSASVNLETATLPLQSRWQFGDGKTASGLHARHAFERPGTYTVVFTLSNTHGTATDSLTVTVSEPVLPDSSGPPSR